MMITLPTNYEAEGHDPRLEAHHPDYYCIIIGGVGNIINHDVHDDEHELMKWLEASCLL